MWVYLGSLGNHGIMGWFLSCISVWHVVASAIGKFELLGLVMVCTVSL